jgi:hypothetical protein
MGHFLGVENTPGVLYAALAWLEWLMAIFEPAIFGDLIEDLLSKHLGVVR